MLVVMTNSELIYIQNFLCPEYEIPYSNHVPKIYRNDKVNQNSNLPDKGEAPISFCLSNF